MTQALAHGKPFAVVPCCVFAHLSPHRTLEGRPVRSIDEFWWQVDACYQRASRAVEEAGRPANAASHVEDVVPGAYVERVSNELAAGPASDVKLVGASQRVGFQSVWVESGCG